MCFTKFYVYIFSLKMPLMFPAKRCIRINKTTLCAVFVTPPLVIIPWTRLPRYFTTAGPWFLSSGYCGCLTPAPVLTWILTMSRLVVATFVLIFLCKLRFPSTKSFVEVIRNRYNDLALNLYRRFERLDFKIRKAKLDLEFFKNVKPTASYLNFLI